MWKPKIYCRWPTWLGNPHCEENGEIKVNTSGYEVIRDVQKQVRQFHTDYPQLLIEYKSLSTAVHYRIAPQLEHIVKVMMREMLQADPNNLALQDGKMVVELKLRGADKGTAIKQLMQNSAFTGKTPIFAGDDVTDEYGFEVINKLGGISIKVGDGRTSAAYCVKSTEELHYWLKGMANE